MTDGLIDGTINRRATERRLVATTERRSIGEFIRKCDEVSDVVQLLDVRSEREKTGPRPDKELEKINHGAKKLPSDLCKFCFQ